MTEQHSTLVFEALVVERLNVCELLRSLDGPDWDSPSSCAGWSVQDVVAHLTLSTRTSALDFVSAMIRHRGDFDEVNATEARKRSAEFPPAQLVEQLYDDARSTKKSLGSSHADGLTDVIVHAQDIARPCARAHTTPPDRVVIALDHVVTSRWYEAKRGFGHATVTATDIDWSHGSAAETISGSAIDLLLAGTGRSSGVDQLVGTGVDTLRAHLAALPQSGDASNLDIDPPSVKGHRAPRRGRR